MSKTYKQALREHDLMIRKEMAGYSRKTVKILEAFLSKNLPDFMKETVRKCELVVDEIERKTHSFTFDGIWVDYGLWGLFANIAAPDHFALNFHVNMDPSEAAQITKEVLEVASELDMKVDVGPCYAFKADQNGEWVETLFSDDAYSLVGRRPNDILG